MSASQPAEPHRGRRLRLHARLQGEEVAGWAGLWLRVDGWDGSALAFDNMEDRPLRGAFGWTPASVVLDVPGDAAMLAYGMLLAGTGAVRADGLELEVVDEATPPTRPPGIRGWMLSGRRLDAYRLAAEPDGPPGRRSAVLRALSRAGGALRVADVRLDHVGADGRVPLSGRLHNLEFREDS